MSSDRMEETRPYVSGACAWPRVEASSPETGPSSPLLASLLSCFIGIWVTTRAVHPVLRSSGLRIQIMFIVAKPRVPMTACRVGPSQGRPEKLAASDFSF